MKLIENKNLNEFMVPTNDYIFKRIFGYVGNENITKNLLESILKIKINSVSLDGNTILEKDLASDKIGILDVKAILENKIPCDIEIQVVPFDNITKRLLFYWSKLYLKTINSGDSYDNLQKAIVILIADFDFKKIDNLKNINDYHTKWQITADSSTKHILTDAFEIHTISLKLVEKLFKKSYNEDSKDLIRWLKFIKEPSLLEEKDMENVNIKEAKEQLDELKKSKYEQELAEYRMKEIRDKKAIESYGFNTGKEEGRKEGKKEKQIEIAKKMLKENMDINLISKLTSLTENEIRKLN